MKTIANLFEELGYPYQEMDINNPIDVSDKNCRIKSNGDDWVKVTKIVRKEPASAILVKENDLKVSPMHLFWAKVGDSEPHWVEAIALVGEQCEILSAENTWQRVTVVELDELIDILDVEVEGEKYITNGLLSHNTMYSDPTTTPGGKAIPFHASVRIKLGAGQPIKDSNGDVIGINVSAKTVKNKVSPPFRSCNFQIHFGKGIFENEELFDAVRKGGEHEIDGKRVEVSGTGSWKHFTVIDTVTGEVEIERKFHKKSFGDLYDDPETAEWIEKLTEVIFVKKMNSPDSIDIDPESYVEMESLANELLDDFVDPETA